ncbi:two-component regulator propeller domain-containing protein [Pedobacter gandavensis]|uniref:hybrid sensor histidine kinase/response regulator transcription factor n=1 Tax=Pedobacter gandavensis TaxID=2679963 RepID=UPI0029308DD8|nr:two-component regulator propeller domain-containing protein [Pedobacter gandavensis]
MIKQTILSISLLLMQLCSSGQTLNFNHLKTEDGLSQNSIFAITQDGRGLMWFGSRFGLNRYDGNQFQLYKSKANDSSSLSDDYVTALHSDRKKVLWVGTANGLNQFNPQKNTFERIYLDGNKHNKQYAPVNAIYEDRKGNLWVAGRTGLYLLTNRNTNTFTPTYKLGLKSGIANSEVLSIFEDHQGYLWIGTNSGLSKLSFNGRLQELARFSHNPAKTSSLSDNSVTAITEDLQKNLWVATESAGINLFQPGTGTFLRYGHEEGNKNSLIHNSVRRMTRNKAGNLCIGTQEGLSILDPASRKFQSQQHLKSVSRSLNQNSIYSIYEDPNGSLWIGTYYGGVNVSYAHDTNFKTMQYNEKLAGISHNVVSSIIADNNDNLWIGTEGGGLNHLNRQTQQFTTYKLKASEPESLGSDLVKVIYKDKGGDIWVGTHGGGLNLFDPQTRTFKRFFINGDNTKVTRSELVALMEDHNSAFWTGSQTGIRIFTKKAGLLTPYSEIPVLRSIRNYNIKVLFEDSRKNIWIASTKGLFLLSADRKQLQSFKLPKGSNSVNNNANYINCIQEDAKGNIWVGLYYGGLSKYEPGKKRFVKNYTTADGLPNDNVVGILEDNQHLLWVSTSNGLARFNPISSVFLTYTTSDGLAGDEFNYNSFFKAKNGDLYFGGYNGLSYFSPKDIEKNSYHAPLVFTGLKLFNEPVQINAENGLLQQDISFTHHLTFPYQQNIFTIEFALLNYIKSNKNKYAYRLEGVNGNWVETAVPAATYTNLASGNYTLWVKGANNDGIWSQPVAMKIKILPPFWKSWWAYLIYLAIIGMMLFFITRFFFLRGLLLKDEELHQIKLNFFTNISHEIRTHLTLIMAPIENLLAGQDGDSPLKQQLHKVKNNADRLLKLVNELMDFRKAETKNLKLKVAEHDFIPFIQEIYSSFTELSAKKNIDFSLKYEESAPLNQSPLLLYFDKEQLEKVFFNLLSNAFKFTPEAGRITIEIKTSAKALKVKICDTGRGIAPEYLEQLFENYFQVEEHHIQNTGYGIGLALSKHIVELHQGNIEVSSEQGAVNKPGFTCFELSLLLGKAHFPGLQQGQQSVSAQPELRLLQTGQQLVQPQPVQESAASLATAKPETADMATPEQEKKATILVVEDHAELRNLIKEALQDSYQVILAENGRIGWEKATEEIPDLIISDVMMPEMDGFTLCSQLKTDERTNHIPVFLLTAKSSQSDQISGLSLGADLYLSKPFSTKILQLQVRNFLAAREQMRKKYSKELVLEYIPLMADPKDELFLSRLTGIIEEHMEQEDFGVELMAEKIGMSQSVLYKKLKALTDLSVNDFAKTIRLKKAAQLLLQNRYTVYEVGYMVGFSDRKYFSREFKKQFSKTPSEYIGSKSGAADEGASPAENK